MSTILLREDVTLDWISLSLLLEMEQMLERVKHLLKAKPQLLELEKNRSQFQEKLG